MLTQEMPTNKEMNPLRNLLTSAMKKKKRRRRRIVIERVVCWWRWMRDHGSNGTVRAF